MAAPPGGSERTTDGLRAVKWRLAVCELLSLVNRPRPLPAPNHSLGVHGRKLQKVRKILKSLSNLHKRGSIVLCVQDTRVCEWCIMCLYPASLCACVIDMSNAMHTCTHIHVSRLLCNENLPDSVVPLRVRLTCTEGRGDSQCESHPGGGAEGREETWGTSPTSQGTCPPAALGGRSPAVPRLLSVHSVPSCGHTSGFLWMKCVHNTRHLTVTGAVHV